MNLGRKRSSVLERENRHWLVVLRDLLLQMPGTFSGLQALIQST